MDVSTAMGSEDFLVFECGRCGCTYTGKPHEVLKLGWVRHDYARTGMRRKSATFLLCDTCTAHFEPIWKERA